MLLSPATDLTESWFRGREARALVLGNAGHADIPLAVAGLGAVRRDHVDARRRRSGSRSPKVGPSASATPWSAGWSRAAARCGAVSEVVQVVVDDGRASRRPHGGRTRIAARRAVLADVVAPRLYGGLVAPADLPAAGRPRDAGFRLDPGTVKVDFALDGPVPWAVTPDAVPGTVHVSPSPDALARSLGQVAAGEVPASPSCWSAR